MRSFLPTCFLILPFLVFSQIKKGDFEFNLISSNDGLSGNSVDYIVQDSIGYLWFSTGAGLERFNGRTFKHFSKNLRSSFDAFFFDQKLYVDKDQNLWVLNSDNHIEKFDYSKETFKKINGIRNPKCIIQNTKGDWYIGTVGNGIYKIDKTNSDTLKITPQGLGDIQFHFFTEYKNKIYATSYHQVFEIENDRVTTMENMPGVEFSYTAIASNKKHSIWIGTEKNSLFQHDEQTNSFKKFTGFLPEMDFPGNLHISYLIFDSEDRLWVSTYGSGVYLIDFESQQIQHFKNDKSNERSLSHSGAISIYIDDHERVWLSTPEGANYYDKYIQNFEIITGKDLPEGQDISIVRSIDMDNRGNIWVATLLSGISKIDINNKSVKTYTQNNSGLKTDENYFARIFDDELWILHSLNDIQIFQPPDTFTDLNLNKEENYFSNAKEVFEDSRGLIWILTTDEYLLKFDKKNKEIERILFDTKATKNLQAYNIYSIAEAADYQLWLGTFGEGLIHYNIESKDYTFFRNILPGNIITDIHPTAVGSLYIAGHKDGLLHFNPETGVKKSYSISNGFATSNLYGILSHKDELWISSSRGLIRFNKETEAVKNFDLSDGLQGLEFNTKARYRDPESGILFFGGENGINWFHPDQIKINPYPPETVITDLHLFEDQFKLDTNFKFKHNQNTLTFFFDGLHYSLPDKNRFKYKIENYDSDWIDGKSNNSVRYTNLPPGDYKFQVLAANYDGIWDESPATYKFSILKPWYATNLLLFIYVIIIITLSFYIYHYLKSRWRLKAQLELEHKEAERLKQLDELKTRLYTNLSHEFRTPLTLISGPIEEQLNKKDIKDQDRNALEMVRRNTNRMLSLVNQLLDLAKLESGNMKLQVFETNIKLLLEQIFESFKYQICEKKIDFRFELKDIEKGWIDPEVLEKVTTNLLGNAVKYTPNNGFIYCDVQRNENNLILHFVNNGNTLKSNELPRLFERYARGETNSTGSGIGLALVRELVTLSHGNVTATALNYNRIQFSVILPVNRHLYSEDEISEDIKSDEKKFDIKSELNFSETDKSGGKDILLIIDDHEEIRNYLNDIFKSRYKTYLAENGHKGLLLAQEKIPDIIISDVMMPVMDGVEMTEKLKTNELTSHIPVLLLTAKSGNKNEITGLKCGADDYITKPFNVDKLKLKTANLLSLRNNLRKKYEQIFKLNNLQGSNLEEQFLKRIQVVLNVEITNPDLTAESLAIKMNMSRTQLHRKLKAITNKSTTQFIREQRNRLAMDLLENSDDSVSEIAYKVGYNSPSYFISCFKKEFNQTPSDFRA